MSIRHLARRFVIVFIALTAIILFCSCNGSNGTVLYEDEETISNEYADFSFNYPSTWQIDRNGQVVVLRAESGSAGTVMASIVATSFAENKYDDVKKYWEEQSLVLKSTVKKYSLVAESESTLGGEPAITVDYKAVLTYDDGEDGEVHRFLQIFAIHNGRIYTVTFQSLSGENFDDYCSAFETVKSNYKFVEAVPQKENLSEQPDANRKKAANKVIDCHFYYPESWILRRDDGMIAIKPSDGNASLCLTVVASDKTAKEYWEGLFKATEETFYIADAPIETATELGGVVALRVDYSMRQTQNAEIYKFTEIICQREGTIYRFTFTASEEEYSEYEDIIEYTRKSLLYD